jgi:hypothetical protein
MTSLPSDEADDLCQVCYHVLCSPVEITEGLKSYLRENGYSSVLIDEVIERMPK